MIALGCILLCWSITTLCLNSLATFVCILERDARNFTKKVYQCPKSDVPTNTSPELAESQKFSTTSTVTRSPHRSNNVLILELSTQELLGGSSLLYKSCNTRCAHRLRDCICGGAAHQIVSVSTFQPARQPYPSTDVFSTLTETLKFGTQCKPFCRIYRPKLSKMSPSTSKKRRTYQRYVSYAPSSAARP